MHHRRCRCRTGSAALFFVLADPLADVIPIVGHNALSDGRRRELRVLPPNGLGCCLPLGVLFACLLRLRGVVLLGPSWRMSGQPICAERMPSCATSSHVTDFIVHLNARKPLDSTMPKRGAPARMASAM